jgi:hypothetical protein
MYHVPLLPSKEVAPERKLRTSGKANLFLNRNGVGNAGNIPSVPGFSQDLEKLGLTDLAGSLSKQTGRDVSFMIYGSEDAIKARLQPYLPLK